ncbi:NAD(P)-dependent oxidoreductase [Ferruginibacter sp. HRS2-29]|uniref:NAD-dependent epimerase/dehydratase family protein n=1 Tax=Ferruginibacter sp. HRS2-29 TaxID=2487334 RepID=UPI0020CC03B2|nr:SDR family oxidoreductase [Ferruginibacter sp. HRS2-29]MCP9749911.1 SDR family oxidoreductase [Ferruginibacter sp. HRS2-29]
MITILGATGYIGSHLLQQLQAAGEEVYAPRRNELPADKELGDVIYCIGMTADFRAKPFETVDAHITVLSEVLQQAKFRSLTYLSSTRVYINSAEKKVEETSPILIKPWEADELYTLTKLTGERLCLSSGRNVKIARLSNIVGNDLASENFLTVLVREIRQSGSFHFQSSLRSAKDYLHIQDAVDMLLKIAVNGKQQVYNVASGINTSNADLVTLFSKHTAFSVTVKENAPDVIFPEISVKRIRTEFDFCPKNIEEYIPTLLKKNNNV